MDNFNGGLECTKDLQAESVDILKGALQKTFPAYSASTPWEYAVSYLKWCFIFYLSGELKNHSDYGKSWFLKMIMKSIIPMTNKQRDNACRHGSWSPPPRKRERQKERDHVYM